LKIRHPFAPGVDAMYGQFTDEQLVALFRDHRDVCALAELHARLGAAVKRAVVRRLGSEAWDKELVEQLAEEPWRWLAQRSTALYRFDPAKATARVYLTLLGAHAVHCYRRRARSKRPLRPQPLGGHEPIDPHSADAEFWARVAEFESLLAGSQAHWWHVEVRGEHLPPDTRSFSARHWRRLGSSVLHKLLKHLADSGD
jgi:hypothetical protein